MKKLQNNFTTPEQSKRLIELGVPADSADCFYDKQFFGGTIIQTRMGSDWRGSHDLFSGVFKNYITPCWSVGRLIEIFDMCYQREPEESITEHWILTQEATENFGSYIEYLVQTFCVQKKFLDFSKLED